MIHSSAREVTEWIIVFQNSKLRLIYLHMKTYLKPCLLGSGTKPCCNGSHLHVPNPCQSDQPSSKKRVRYFFFSLWLQYSRADIQLLLKALHKHFSWYLQGYSESLYFSSEWSLMNHILQSCTTQMPRECNFTAVHQHQLLTLHCQYKFHLNSLFEWFAGFLKVEIVIKCLFRQQMYCSSLPANHT